MCSVMITAQQRTLPKPSAARGMSSTGLLSSPTADAAADAAEAAAVAAAAADAAATELDL